MPALVAGKTRRVGAFLGREFSDLRPRWAQVSVLMDGGTLPDTPSNQMEQDATRALEVEVLPEALAGDSRKAIVTGANSFVGVHIVQALLAGGAQGVACLVRELPGHSAAAAAKPF